MRGALACALPSLDMCLGQPTASLTLPEVAKCVKTLSIRPLSRTALSGSSHDARNPAAYIRSQCVLCALLFMSPNTSPVTMPSNSNHCSCIPYSSATSSDGSLLQRYFHHIQLFYPRSLRLLSFFTPNCPSGSPWLRASMAAAIEAH